MPTLISVVNYFSSSLLDECMQSIVENARPQDHHFVIYDNSVDDEEWRLIANLGVKYAADFSSVRVHRAPANIGFGAGHNRNYEHSANLDFDSILILNPDVTVLHGCLTQLSRRATVTSCIVSVPCRQNESLSSGFSRIEKWSGRALRTHSESKAATAYPDGHFMIIGRRTWDTVGGFDERFFLYGEEIDLTLRARAALSDFTLVQHPDALVVHLGAATTSTDGKKSTVAVLHANRSRVLLYRTHASLRKQLPILIAVRTVSALLALVRGDRTLGAAAMIGLWQGLRWR